MRILHWHESRSSPDEIYRLNQAQIPARRPFPTHGYDFAEFFWTLDGKAMHDLNGKSLPIQRGSAVFIRPQDFHGFRPAPGELLVQYNLVVPMDIVDDLQQRYFPGQSVFFWKEDPDPHQLELTSAQLRRLDEFVKTLIGMPTRRIHLDQFLLNHFHELNPEPALPLDPQVPDWIADACRNARQPDVLRRGCGAFIELAGRSPEHVSRVFHQTMGQTLNQYITQLRLEYAERELVCTSTPILEVAQDCGYESLSHFYRLFSNRYGVPPRKYRQQHWLHGDSA